MLKFPLATNIRNQENNAPAVSVKKCEITIGKCEYICFTGLWFYVFDFGCPLYICLDSSSDLGTLRDLSIPMTQTSGLISAE